MRRLLIRPGAIGDCILSFPALEFLRTDYTEIWAPTPVVPLIDFADRVSALSSTGLDMVSLGDRPMDPVLRDRLQTFDEIVSWYGTNRDEFRSAMKELSVPCKFHQALPSPAGTVHATDFFCAQVGAPAGEIPRIRLNSAPVARKTIVIHPFSGSASKNWPLACFREVATALAIEVEWLAGPEETLAEAHRFDSLRYVAEWLSGARLYLGNDSGITHLAAAVGVPVVVLFRTTSADVWAPRGNCVTVVQQSGLTVRELSALLAKRIAR